MLECYKRTKYFTFVNPAYEVLHDKGEEIEVRPAEKNHTRAAPTSRHTDEDETEAPAAKKRDRAVIWGFTFRRNFGSFFLSSIWFLYIWENKN